MTSSDDELERLKRRKLLELQRRLMKERQAAEEAEKPEPSPDDVFNSCFVGRAWEVLHAARNQFPKVMPQLEAALVEAIKEGKIRQKIDGESLFQFLRQVGLPVRLQTSIRYKEHGELKTISQRLKQK